LDEVQYFNSAKTEFALGLLLRILWWSQNGNHQENNFSQIWLDTKVGRKKKKKKDQNPSILLAT
jgi:hypothetical protein